LEQGSGKLLQHYQADGFMLGRNGSLVIDTESSRIQSPVKMQFRGRTKLPGTLAPAAGAVNSMSARTIASNADLVGVDLVGTVQ
jgi:hypothetical protein